jgi:hypothetical protein
VVWTVVYGACWREDQPWLPLYASAQRACPGSVDEREGGQGEVGSSSLCRVGSRRVVSGRAGCWLGVEGSGEEEERGESDLGKILPRAPLLPCVQPHGDKRKRLEWREGREGERDGRLGLALD